MTDESGVNFLPVPKQRLSVHAAKKNDLIRAASPGYQKNHMNSGWLGSLSASEGPLLELLACCSSRARSTAISSSAAASLAVGVSSKMGSPMGGWSVQ